MFSIAQPRPKRVSRTKASIAPRLRERSASTSIASSLNRGRNEGERGASEARVVPQTPWRIGIALRQDLTLGIRRSQAPAGKNKR